RLVQGGRWDFDAAMEVVSRQFRNVPAGLPLAAKDFFRNGETLEARVGAHRSLLRVPERRFAIEVSGQAKAGHNYASGLGAFAALRGEARSHWRPREPRVGYGLTGGWVGGGKVGGALHQHADERCAGPGQQLVRERHWR